MTLILFSTLCYKQIDKEGTRFLYSSHFTSLTVTVLFADCVHCINGFAAGTERVITFVLQCLET